MTCPTSGNPNDPSGKHPDDLLKPIVAPDHDFEIVPGADAVRRPGNGRGLSSCRDRRYGENREREQKRQKIPHAKDNPLYRAVAAHFVARQHSWHRYKRLIIRSICK